MPKVNPSARSPQPSLPNRPFSRAGSPAVAACGYSVSETTVGRLHKRTDQPSPESWKQRLQEQTAWAGTAHSRSLRLQDWDDGCTSTWLHACSHCSSDLFYITAHPSMLQSSSDIYLYIYHSYFFTVTSTQSVQVPPHSCLLKPHKQKAARCGCPPSTHWSSPVSVCGWHSPDLHSPEPALLLHSHRHVAVPVGTVTLSLGWPVGTTGTTGWEPPQNSFVPCDKNSKGWVRCELPCISQYLCALSSSHSRTSALYWSLFAFLLSHLISCTLFDKSWGEDKLYQFGVRGKKKREEGLKPFSNKGFIQVSHRLDQIPLLSANLKAGRCPTFQMRIKPCTQKQGLKTSVITTSEHLRNTVEC